MATPKKIQHYGVERHEGAIMLPKGVSYTDAADHLYRLAEQEQEAVNIVETIPVYPYDGAIALEKAVIEIYGLAKTATMTVQGMFGPSEAAPQSVVIQVGVDETREIMWGGFRLPGVPGKVQCGHTKQDGMIVFQVSAQTIHKHKAEIKALFARTREIALVESIYRGKAFEVRFRDEDGERTPLPTIRFLHVDGIKPIFNDDLELRLRANILNHFSMTKAVAGSGTGLKRGVLLAGKYGTGKTLVANLIARESTAGGWTYIYVPSANEFPDAFMLARQFQPAVVLVEDIDQVIEERDERGNAITNVLDGVDGKTVEIVTIMTTNFPERINAAMYRPGRIDLPLEVKPPNTHTVGRLIRYFAGQSLPAVLGADDKALLDRACTTLNGTIPATIHEVVKNAKLYALDRTFGKSCDLTGADILHSANEVLDQQRFILDQLKSKEPIDPLHALTSGMVGGFQAILENYTKHGDGSSLLRRESSRIKARMAEIGEVMDAASEVSDSN